ncbi:hypothetical protein SDC9_192497 [bioreactor metagenome]|uniref:Uncharacterized protein n=1 Tax=bioreactor metagenome TaxID=1076179 RepID=A0A645I1A2_9ZZZZ
MDPAALLGNLRPRNIHNTFLGVVHHGHPGRDTLTHNRTGGECPVTVKDFDPVVILDTQIFRIRFAHPHDRTAAA